MPTLRHPQWRDGNSGNKYPFDDTATLVNAAGRAIDPDTFIDAAIYPIGGSVGMYISSVDVRADEITIFIGDSVLKSLCYCAFSPAQPAEELRIVDRFGRSAGVLVSKAVNLSVFSAWGAGVHVFLPTQTRFVASCCYPVPADTVIGFRLDDGSVVSGDVLLVGEDGIAFDCKTIEEWPASDANKAIQVSAVGDPLYRRKQCPTLFSTPRFIREIAFQKGTQTIFVKPGEDGNVIIANGAAVIPDSVLRVRTSPQGVMFEVVGERLDDF
jgi:hypothetical protein